MTRAGHMHCQRQIETSKRGDATKTVKALPQALESISTICKPVTGDPELTCATRSSRYARFRDKEIKWLKSL